MPIYINVLVTPHWKWSASIATIYPDVREHAVQCSWPLSVGGDHQQLWQSLNKQIKQHIGVSDESNKLSYY